MDSTVKNTTDMITFLTLKSGHQQEIVAIYEESLGRDKSDMEAVGKWTQSYHQAAARYQKADTALITELGILWDINEQIFDLLESLES